MYWRAILTLILAVALGSNLYGCCCGGGGGGDVFDEAWDEAWDEAMSEAMSEPWGKVKATKETKVYSSNSDTSDVLVTMATGDKLDYYGFDDTFVYYKVKTADGKDGYVNLLEVEVVYE